MPSQGSVTISDVQVRLSFWKETHNHENSWFDFFRQRQKTCIHGIVTSAICSFLCSRYCSALDEHQNRENKLNLANCPTKWGGNWECILLLLFMSSHVHNKIKGSAEVQALRCVSFSFYNKSTTKGFRSHLLLICVNGLLIQLVQLSPSSASCTT